MTHPGAARGQGLLQRERNGKTDTGPAAPDREDLTRNSARRPRVQQLVGARLTATTRLANSHARCRPSTPRAARRAALPSATSASSAAGRARRAYRLGIGLAATGLILTAGAVAAALSDVSVSSRPSHVVSTAGIQVALPSANPAAVILLVLATLGIAVMLAVVRGLFVMVRAHRRLRQRLPVVGPLRENADVAVIAHDGVQAFCAGRAPGSTSPPALCVSLAMPSSTPSSLMSACTARAATRCGS